MRQALCFSFLILFLTTLSRPVDAKKTSPRDFQHTIAAPRGATDNPAANAPGRGFAALAANDTTWLYSANFNGQTCQTQGWTSSDLTAQSGDYWHVDDYAGLPFGPVAGAKSLWCGARAGTDPIRCSYLALPGYGNSWNQSWCTKTCLAIAGGATTNLDVSFTIRYDTETSYDGTALEYTTDCSGDLGWTEIDGGVPSGWDGSGTAVVNGHYAVGAGPVKVRLHFTSDSAWSDQDGFFPTDGAAHVDNLKAEGLALEDFEDEAVGAIASNDWQSCNAAYGDNAILLHGADVLQQDPCRTNLSCLWAFIKNSTAYYSCGGYPAQKVVPYVNDRGQYINNEIWSPWIPLSGSGTKVNLRYDVYRDLPTDALIYYTWQARTIVNGCPTPWKNRNFFYNGDEQQWFTQTDEIGSLLNLGSATHIQVSLGVIDLCPFHCGIFGTGQCHTPAPYFDNVSVYRVNSSGPQWSVRDIDIFQDTFASDGTLTGKGRADTAADIKPSSSPSFTPGDSAIVLSLMDGNYAGTATNSSGLSDDPNVSTFIGRHKTKKAVYMWVAVWPQGQPNKSGDGLSEGPGGQANRYPHIAAKDYVDSHGVSWTAIRADFTYTGSASTPGLGTSFQPIINNRFNVDLNDNLFVPGDTICFFYGATSPGGTTYYSDQWHVTDNIAEVAANPMEFTVLPAGGFNRGGEVLYVDGADGYGVQPYYDGAFMVQHVSDKTDRFDVRGPASGLSNTLSGRLTNIAGQLNAAYHVVLWDCGSLPVTLGDGISRKANDYAMLNSFLGNLTFNGGVFLLGDDVPENLIASPAAEAVAFRSIYIPFTLASGDHVAAGMGISPKIVHWPGRALSTGLNNDFFIFGGCPEINDFDVLHASGTSRIEASYVTAQSASGAVVSNKVPGGPATKTCAIVGFSLAAVRDDELDGISDRALFLRDLVRYSGAGPSAPITGAGPSLSNSLAQNYPNPFNPQTTIAFSIAERANVRVAVYNVNGALVRTLANESRAAGAYELTWDGRDDGGRQVASGVYFYRLTAGSFTQTKKMVLLK